MTDSQVQEARDQLLVSLSLLVLAMSERQGLRRPDLSDIMRRSVVTLTDSLVERRK